MIDVSKLPAVRAQLERDIAAKKQPRPEPKAAQGEYARAPQANGAKKEPAR